jgi:hypothetical protein
MSGPDLRSGIRMTDGDWRQYCRAQTGAGRIARLKAVPLAAWVGSQRAVLLDLKQCRAAGGVPVRVAIRPLPSPSSARHRLDRYAPV